MLLVTIENKYIKRHTLSMNTMLGHARKIGVCSALLIIYFFANTKNVYAQLLPYEQENRFANRIETSQERYQKLENELAWMEQRLAEQQITPDDSKQHKVTESSNFKPYTGIGYGAVYDSNPRGEYHDDDDEVYHAYSTMIGFRNGNPNIANPYVDQNYELTYLDYIENDKNSRFNHSFTTDVKHDQGKTVWTIRNQFIPASSRNTADRRELRRGGNSEIVAHSDYFNASVEHSLTAHWLLYYQHNYKIEYYPQSSNPGNVGVEAFSNQRHEFVPGFAYKFSDKSQLYFDTQFGTSDYLKDGIYAHQSRRYRLGFKTNLTPKTYYENYIGYYVRDYNLNEIRDDESIIYDVSIIYQATPKSFIRVSTGKDLAEDLDFTGSTGFAQSSNRHDYYVRASYDWFVSTAQRINLYSQVSWTGRDGVIRMDDIENPNIEYARTREDNNFEWGIFWLWTPRPNQEYTIGYRYYERESTFKDFEFIDHKIIGSAKYKFY